MATAIKSPSLREIPTVNPGQLHHSYKIVYQWIGEGELDTATQRQVEDDLFAVVNQIALETHVDMPAAVALFKRSLALLAFCIDTDLPPDLFDDGLPGRELCAAASKAPVQNHDWFGPNMVSPYFAPDDLTVVLRSALN